MLSTPATRSGRLYLPLSLPTPLLSPITSYWPQVGGAPPQHTHTCVATCKPQINFQRKFTISVKLFFSSFFSRHFLNQQFIMVRILFRITSGSTLACPSQYRDQKHTIQRIFSFFPLIRAAGSFFSLPSPPHLAITVYTYYLSHCTASTTFSLYSRTNSTTAQLLVLSILFIKTNSITSQLLVF